MKILNYSFVLLFFSFLAACAARPETTVASDQRVDSQTSFDNYRTFAWASHVDNKENGLFFLNDLILKSMVRDGVEHELKSRGYVYDASNPDLVVNFRIFEEPVKITGVQEFGTNYWAATDGITGYDDTRTYELEKGSLIMQLADRKTGKVVWQGYASGFMDGNVFDKSRDKVTMAVSRIFEQYGHRAPSASN